VNRIFCAALPLLLHLLDINSHLLKRSASPNAVTLSADLRAVKMHRPQSPDWAQKVIEYLRLRFRHELDYILRIVQAIQKSHSPEYEEVQKESSSRDRQVEGSLRAENWRELLNTRPKLYACLIDTLDCAISWGGPLPEIDMPSLFPGGHEPPRSSLDQQFRAGKAALPLSPLLSPASSQRNIMEQMSPSVTCGDEPMRPDQSICVAPRRLERKI
jgi:hypothetical protein